MTGTPEEWNISVCGLNCARCDIYSAHHGNEEALKGIVDWFKKERNETVRPESITCEGCRGQINAHWSPNCKMMACARERGHRYCFECDDFPCQKLADFSSDGISHRRRPVENMKRMKEIGVEAWISEQKRKGKTTFCP